MTVDFTSTDLWEKEPNNSSSQASDIALGKTYTGVILQKVLTGIGTVSL